MYLYISNLKSRTTHKKIKGHSTDQSTGVLDNPADPGICMADLPPMLMDGAVTGAGGTGGDVVVKPSDGTDTEVDDFEEGEEEEQSDKDEEDSASTSPTDIEVEALGRFTGG